MDAGVATQAAGFWPTDAAGWATVLAFVLAAFAFLVGGPFGLIIHYGLGDEPSRARLERWLSEQSALVRYWMIVEGGLERLDRFFGPAWCWKAFDRCLVLAYLYPLLFFLAGWVFDGPASATGGLFLSSDLSPTQRVIIILALVTLSILVGIAFRRSRALAAWLARVLFREHSSERSAGCKGILLKLLMATVGTAVAGTIALVGLGVLVAARPVAVAAALALALVGAVSVLGAGASALVVGFAVAVVGALAGALAKAGAFATALALAGVVAGAYAVAGAGATALAGALAAIAVAGAGAGARAPVLIPLLTFFVLLPIINALLDWPSWAVSRGLARHLMGRLKQGKTKFVALGHILADSVLALAFLFGLALLLPAPLQAINAGSVGDGAALIVWAPMVDAALRAPWTEGLAVTAMLVTTLVPTILHLAAALFALGLAPLPWHGRVVRCLGRETAPDGMEKAGIAAWVVLFFYISLGAVLLGCWGLWWVFDAFTGKTVGQALLTTACTSAQWIGGPGIPDACTGNVWPLPWVVLAGVAAILAFAFTLRLTRKARPVPSVQTD